MSDKMENKKIFRLNIIYLIIFCLSVAFLFLPWSYELGFVYLGVEILHLFPLLILTICFFTTSAILYFVHNIYSSSRKILYIVGFGLGLSGSTLGMISGIFGIYYCYYGLRRMGVFLWGSCLYWALDALLLISCILIFKNNLEFSSKPIPVVDL